jgi:SAM-dependent methyltransferase
MQTPPKLADRNALRLHRERSLSGALFLHEQALLEIKERLTDVNRTFRDIAVVTGQPDFWAREFPDARVVPDDEVLALEAGASDLVIHALALHWADDPVGQMIQCRRALREDGLFLAVSLGGETLSELRAALAKAEVQHRGGLSPRVAPMSELRDSGALLQRAGFALPVADAVRIPTEYRSAMHLMQDLRAMGETNALATRDRSALTRPLLADLLEFYAANFPGGSGRVRATFEMIYLTGWAPADSQPRPLRPGSASHRLAEALGTTELDTDGIPVNDETTSNSRDG